MGNSFFRFKHFVVNQKDSAMRVNTDGVLLGAWMNLDSHYKNLLDIGTGTGVIALMAAQRMSALCAHRDNGIDGKFHILGIDSDSSSCDEAGRNFAASLWRNNLAAANITFQVLSASDTEKNPGAKAFDFIFSNPPYFSDSLQSPDKERNAARHNESLSQADLLNGVISLLSAEGKFALILPSDEADEFLRKAEFLSRKPECALYLQRRCNVIYKKGEPAERAMLELAKSERPVCVDIQELVLGDGNGYSEEYKSLTKDFYLKF